MVADGTGASTGEHIRARRKTCGSNADCPRGLTCHDALFTNICLTPGNAIDKGRGLAGRIGK